MSRPFSYNDENFTVIGSLLIIHVPYSGVLKMNESICDVPPEIVKRLKYLNFVGCYNKSPFSPTPDISMFVQGGRLCITNSGGYNDGQFFAIIDLKDI